MSDPLWYKDAVVYQLHVKAFFDANDDGIGDFAGLAAKLDYVQSLGVTAIWLLPFYPSPLRDDGYDIADYRNVNPDYGTLREFRRFVREAHARGLRVITELVVNHTSDQHPWFQRARRARPGSAARNYYVWSDTDRKYEGTRIIFTDTEASNWAWDPVAQSYYWHRFFSHQPDLNFDNPRVLEALVANMAFWLRMGVDGLRLDAIPYLCEREGTNNENLPETHAVVRQIRAALDARFADRMLLAEANQWPEDVRPYFGDGDECHMAFHFPLMPRIYMALAQEDRHPVTDIMRQTPPIPESCQWAIFLRNHDELTLEMVSDRERDYLWKSYAADPRAKLNLGIRRRLAPLLDNDRRKIELLNSLLMSMPGTPIVYYGDEIGMGDNFYLGDRNGMRTPMQWSPDRNGGFSRADPAKLFLPAIMDSVYGYEAVNAEAQSRSPSSLLNWTRRLITVRRNYRAFGRGTISFLYPSNRKVMAYLREHEDETILCIVNFSRAPQAAELDLADHQGRVPVELFGQTPFPPIGELPYFVTLPGYGFYWFLLAERSRTDLWQHEEAAVRTPELPTLVIPRGWQSLASAESESFLAGRALPDFIAAQRWFAGKHTSIRAVARQTWAELPDEGGWGLAICEVTTADRRRDVYQIPVSVAWESADEDPLGQLAPFAIARMRQGPRLGVLFDAVADDAFLRRLVDLMAQGAEIPAGDGTIRFSATSRFPAALESDAAIRHPPGEQSNSSAFIDGTGVLKIYRRLEAGRHPEIEMGHYLTEKAGYRNAPMLLGSVELRDAGGRPTALAVLHEMVPNQGNGWDYTLEYLGRFLEDVDVLEPEATTAAEGEHASYRHFARILGTRTAQLHRALAAETGDAAFRTELVTKRDLSRWRRRIQGRLRHALQRLGAARRTADEDTRVLIKHLLDRRKALAGIVDRLLPDEVSWRKARCHGDLHLGQTLVVKDDIFITDFEGEPAVPLAARRIKDSPLRDVAGMVRSFEYAARSAVAARVGGRAGTPENLLSWTLPWVGAATLDFLDAYFAEGNSCPTLPESRREAERLIDLFALEKAFYEVSYEVANRPHWLHIPLEGILSRLEERERR